MPVMITRPECRPLLFTLQDQTGLRGMLGKLDGFIQPGLVGNDAIDFHPAGRRHDHLGRGVIDTYRQLLGGKAAEDH